MMEEVATMLQLRFSLRKQLIASMETLEGLEDFLVLLRQVKQLLQTGTATSDTSREARFTGLLEQVPMKSMEGSVISGLALAGSDRSWGTHSLMRQELLMG